jgi:hypothetical protein
MKEILLRYIFLVKNFNRESIKNLGGNKGFREIHIFCDFIYSRLVCRAINAPKLLVNQPVNQFVNLLIFL